MTDCVLIQARDAKEAYRINYADLRDSFEVNYQLNSNYEISFTLTYTTDYANVWNAAKEKGNVLYNGQWYVIQQADREINAKGLLTLKVTANHSLIDKMKNIRLDAAEPTEENPETTGGQPTDPQDPGTKIDDNVTVKKTAEKQTYTLQDRLSHFFDKNDQNIKYEIHGQFPEVAVDCTDSLYEWLNNHLKDFSAYWIPDGDTLKIYDMASLQHKTGKQFRYLNTMDSVDIQMDVNNLVNDCMVYGGKMEKDITSDGSGGAGDGSGGNLDSVEGFCKSPINADFGVNKAKMIQDFSARSRRAQAWGVDANKLYDVVKQNGVSPEWFFAYELQEQLDTYGRDSWLNHYGYHLADPYQDAANVCNWIKSLAQNPNFTAATESGKGNQALAAQWNKEFPIGTIGRVYLQGTAAAAWELEGIAGGYYGKPLSGCVSVIKSWGGHTNSGSTSSAGWAWPFANIPKDGEPIADMAAQRFGHTGWFGRGGQDFHDGFDFGASRYNGNVLAVHPGTVHQIGNYAGQWWYVWVLSNDGYSEIYQEGFLPGDIYVHEGQQVQIGTPIARVTQDHTHLGITRKQIPVAYYHGFNDDGTWLNPVAVIKGNYGGGQQQKPNRTKEFIDYCRSFVGKVPYVWGGASPSGWDCSGFVTYVLNHFGFNLGTHMTLGLSDLGQVVGPPYQTGDLLFWGPQGNWHHTSIAMDATYRVGADNYQDGTVYRTIASYPPTFGVRIQKLVDLLGGTGDGDSDSTSTTTTQTYYALSFHYENEESIKRYGRHKGKNLTVDGIYDMAQLQKYADETIQHNPATTVSFKDIYERDVGLGDVWRAIVPEMRINYDVTLMGYKLKPYNEDNKNSNLSFNNTGQTMQNVIAAIYRDVQGINNNVNQMDIFGTIGGRYENHFANITGTTGSSTSKDSSVHFSEKQMEAIKKFTDS